MVGDKVAGTQSDTSAIIGENSLLHYCVYYQKTRPIARVSSAFHVQFALGDVTIAARVLVQILLVVFLGGEKVR